MFLDEIGEMNIDLQSKLLRVIENGEFVPLGDTKTKKVNIRIIAATNCNLQKAIAEGKSQDLFYVFLFFKSNCHRCATRLKDIPSVSRLFSEIISAKTNKKISSIAEPAMQKLQHHNYPGNVRRTESIIERAVILCNGSQLTVDDLPVELAKGVLTDKLLILTRTTTPSPLLSWQVPKNCTY